MTLARTLLSAAPSRLCVLVYLCALLAASPLCFAADSALAMFQQRCFQCHGNGVSTAGVNLDKLIADNSIGEDFLKWQKVIHVLEAGSMPPAPIPGPDQAERAAAVGWIRGELQDYIERHAGDPGKVTARRLTSAEYAYTVKDLTGLDLDFGREFAGDAVGGEGFTNFGDVQFMADAKLESYLGAAKRIADHAVIGAGPLEFFGDPGMSGFELSAITRIHHIYREHGFRAVAAEGGRAFGLERYGKAVEVCWRYLHRQALGTPQATLAALAERSGLSARFVEHIWANLEQSAPQFPTSEVVALWQKLPTPSGELSPALETAVRENSLEIQEFIINWPRWLFAAGALAAGGAGDERALVLTDESIQVSRKGQLLFSQRVTSPGRMTAYLSIEAANPRAEFKPTVRFSAASIRVSRDAPGLPLREMLDEPTRTRLGFGNSTNGFEVGPDDFVLAADSSIYFELAIPNDTRFASISADIELLGEAGDAVLRCTIEDSPEGGSGRPAWALLGDSDSPGFKAWKTNVLEYAANFPQTSHGEPTPSDRDPIPPPFNTDYNQPERDLYHTRVKYYRVDDFLVDKMLDDRTRVELDRAWADLLASFEYHNAILRFTAGKFGVDLQGKSVAELTASDIAAMPVEARRYVEPLKAEYEAVMAVQLAARPRHVDDAIEFAQRAWRRPLTDDEQDGLRAFYVSLIAEQGLEHRHAIRALLTRILVSPAFLYRFEQPSELTAVRPLTGFELAGRLSYFLWSSMPDAELLRAAEAGELNDLSKLATQVRRMLADPKIRRFATEFFGQWLGFYRFDQYAGVDAGRFPEFTDKVKAAMYDEAVSFFQYLVENNRPVREIVSADYTFLNKALAGHYGVEKEFASDDKVELVEGANQLRRGGILRLGAVLTATSAPLRTSPVKRGDWVLRRVLGTPTPPPPPDAGSIPADDKLFGGQTVKQRLESHRRNATCVSCHQRIDPLGFPLEHYDAVGRWRTEYSDGQPIEDSAELGNGTTIAGIDGLVEHLEANQPLVLRTLANKLLGYAFGRTLLASDQPLIDEMVAAGGASGVSDLLVKIVSSPQFRNHRGVEDGKLSGGGVTVAGEE